MTTPSDQEEDERGDVESSGAALDRRCSGFRLHGRAASLGRDVGRIAHAVEQVADLGFVLGLEPRSRLGNVLGDLLDELAPARRGEVGQLTLEAIEVVLDQLVSRSAHFDSVLSTK